MRVLHTSDWHLGHRLHRRARGLEHRRFLDWLLDLMQVREVNALLIAGDVFDTANPSAPALELWYNFLATTAKRLGDLQVVVIGGNHDSAARLDAPRDVLRALKVDVIGGARRDGLPRSPQDMVLRLEPAREEDPALWVAAVPFLRPVDLPTQPELSEAQDPLIEGVRAYYQAVFEHMQRRAEPGDRHLAMGHLYLRQGQLSELSERKILGGNQHALPTDIFPDWLSYVALGHLHRAQAVGEERIRYSGSPIPLAMDERHYRHEVTLLDFEEPAMEPRIERIAVPRTIALRRIPDKGSAGVEEVLVELETVLSNELAPPSVDAQALRASETPPAFIEAAVRLTEPDPELRAKVEAVCEAYGHQLCSLIIEYAGQQTSLGEQQLEQELGQLAPHQVLEAMHEANFGQAIDPDLLGAFDELIESMGQEPA